LTRKAAWVGPGPIINNGNELKSQIKPSDRRKVHMTTTCPGCRKEVPDDSTFCLSCGRPLKAEGIDMILPPEGSNTEYRVTMYLVGAIMSLFFGCFLLFPGVFVGLGLIIPAVCLIVLGILFLVMRYRLLKRYAKDVMGLRKEASVRVRCRYCGSLNPDKAEKCDSCGATL
jgi:RNA polymerase subunit RPABC4/transcription elongation factor Spt4